jgi:hypothetical protein
MRRETIKIIPHLAFILVPKNCPTTGKKKYCGHERVKSPVRFTSGFHHEVDKNRVITQKQHSSHVNLLVLHTDSHISVQAY